MAKNLLKTWNIFQVHISIREKIVFIRILQFWIFQVCLCIMFFVLFFLFSIVLK